MEVSVTQLNPLLTPSQLPAFSDIQAQDIEPAITQVIAENLQAIDQLTQQTEPFTWANLVLPLENLEDRLSKIWSPISHLNSVVNAPKLRQAYNACLPKLAQYSSKVGQNQALFKAYLALHKSKEFTKLSEPQQKVITDALQDFELAGIALEGKAQQQFVALNQKMSQLQSQFSDNLLDATDHWYQHFTTQDALAGLPEHALHTAKAMAKQKNQTGWCLGLDFPSYQAVMTYANDRELREQFYTAYVTRSSDQGPHPKQWDNSQLMSELLQLRQQQAKLLGFGNYAEYSLATKMAQSPQQVLDFLTNLADKAKPLAEQEFAELQKFAQQQGIEQLQAWDIAYYSEKLQQQKYTLSQEALRPYFPVPKVLSGLFEVVHRLYGITVTVREEIPTWDPAVKFYEIYDQQQQLRGQFYLDLYARPHKRGGAWMDECRVRRQLDDGQLQTPVAYIICNFGQAIADQPALLTHDEVITLFHEFGHGLHHLLTKMDYAAISGINGVPWDAVELPSQFMENWAWEHEALQLISGHFETGEPLPKAMLDQLKAAKNFQSALFMMRQLELALFDFQLHTQAILAPNTGIQAILDEVRQRFSVIPVPQYNRFQHSFGHIFAGGYAAGYYSYLWAELLACDAYSRFTEEGIFNQKIGHAFLTHILEQGGSKAPSELFYQFRGRAPSIEPLLKQYGLD
jgi:oligopeptidase A